DVTSGPITSDVVAGLASGGAVAAPLAPAAPRAAVSVAPAPRPAAAAAPPAVAASRPAPVNATLPITGTGGLLSTQSSGPGLSTPFTLLAGSGFLALLGLGLLGRRR